MPDSVLLCSPRIVHDTFRVYSQDGFGRIVLSDRVLWGESPILRNKNQQRVRLCRKQELRPSQCVEDYFEIVEEQRARALFYFAYFGVLALLACMQSLFKQVSIENITSFDLLDLPIQQERPGTDHSVGFVKM